MKKAIVILFLLLPLIPVRVAAYDFMEGDICYTIIESDGVPSVMVDQKPSSLGGRYSGVITIPSTVTYQGVTYLVTAIANLSFFACHDLTSVTISDNVTTIGSEAFAECENLTSVTIPNSVTTIEFSAFSGCGLTSIYIPASVVNMDEVNVFNGCPNVTSIQVAADNPVYDSRNNCNAIIVTDDDRIMTGCLNTVIPNGITTIGDFAFSGQKNLPSMILPSSIAWIYPSAFAGCTSLKSIDLPASLKSIYQNAFSSTGLESINIPSKVHSIGKEAFSSCPNLKTITVDASNTSYDSRNNCNAIINSSNNTLVFGCANTVIPYSVTSIGESAFCGTGVTAIAVPSSVTSLGKYVFKDCFQLQSVTLPSSITVIPSYSFNNCSSLLACNIPNSVTKINSVAFQGCSSLKTITIPQSVTNISGNPFTRCSGLISIVVEEGNEVYNSQGNCNAIIETASKKLISGCSTTVIPDEVEIIGSSAFSGINSLQEITIPSSVKTIKGHAFNNTGLSQITIPGNVTTVEDYSFRECGNLSSVFISSGVTTLGEWAFSSCSKLRSVYISQTVTTIGDCCFYGNYKTDTLLTSVSVGNPVPVNITQNTFLNRSRATLHVPEASIAAYQAADVWKEFKYITKLQDSLALGDVNGDGIVNNDDCEAIANFLTGKTTEGFNIHAADVNGDGRIDVADYTAVSHLILYGTITKP